MDRSAPEFLSMLQGSWSQLMVSSVRRRRGVVVVDRPEVLLACTSDRSSAVLEPLMPANSRRLELRLGLIIYASRATVHGPAKVKRIEATFFVIFLPRESAVTRCNLPRFARDWAAFTFAMVCLCINTVGFSVSVSSTSSYSFSFVYI